MGSHVSASDTDSVVNGPVSMMYYLTMKTVDLFQGKAVSTRNAKDSGLRFKIVPPSSQDPAPKSQLPPTEYHPPPGIHHQQLPTTHPPPSNIMDT